MKYITAQSVMNYIIEIALIKEIDDNKNAARELLSCKADTIVFHTSKEEISFELVQRFDFNKFISNINSWEI